MDRLESVGVIVFAEGCKTARAYKLPTPYFEKVKHKKQYKTIHKITTQIQTSNLLSMLNVAVKICCFLEINKIITERLSLPSK